MSILQYISSLFAVTSPTVVMDQQVTESVTKIGKIGDHLEYLGYEVESKTADDGKVLLIARHKNHFNLAVFQCTNEIVMLKATARFKKGKKLPAELETYMNWANKILEVSHAYAEVDNEGEIVLRFETIYAGDYKKSAFAEVISIMNRDMDTSFRGGKNFKKIFLNS
jgi:hypothetical protein